MSSYNSIWFHIGSFLFTSLGFTNDVLKIRILLISGNLFILLNALVGWPFWPDIIRKPITISWDSVIWPVINIVINVYDLLEYKGWIKKCKWISIKNCFRRIKRETIMVENEEV